MASQFYYYYKILVLYFSINVNCLFEKLFVLLKDETSLNYSKFTKPIGILSGIFFSGVGFVPHDLDFGLHVFFANGAFLVLFFLCVFHTMTIYKSKYILIENVVGIKSKAKDIINSLTNTCPLSIICLIPSKICAGGNKRAMIWKISGSASKG